MEEAGLQQEICRVCTRQYARYTCPRCRLRYCSKNCYQQHGQQCTEGFFRESAVAELRSTAASDEERQHMQEILRRVHDSADDGAAAMAEALGMAVPGSAGGAAAVDDGRDGSSNSGSASDEDEVNEAVPLSAATLQRLLEAAQSDADDGGGGGGAALEAALQQLDPRELQEFERFVSSGQASQLIERWQPWWNSPEAGRIHLTARGMRPVKPLAEADTPADELGAPGGSGGAGTAATSVVPEPPADPVLPLRTAAGRPASPLVRWRILEALYAYALALRLYNGDWTTDAPNAAALLLSAVPFLGAQTATEPPATGAEAALQAVTRACGPSGPVAGDRKVANLILGDVAALAALGRSPVLCALADMQRLIAAASAAAAPQQAPQPSPTAAAPPASAVLPQLKAQVQRLARTSGTKSQCGQQRPNPGSGGVCGNGGSKAEKQLRRQLRLAGMHLSGFLLPWANEQAADVFADVAQAAADQWQLWRDSTGQGQDTGDAPAAVAQLTAARRPSADEGAQQPVRPGIVELGSDSRSQLSSTATGLGKDAESVGGGGGGSRVPTARQPPSVHPALAARLSAMSVTGSSQDKRRPALVEELS